MIAYRSCCRQAMRLKMTMKMNGSYACIVGLVEAKRWSNTVLMVAVGWKRYVHLIAVDSSGTLITVKDHVDAGSDDDQIYSASMIDDRLTLGMNKAIKRVFIRLTN